MSIDKCLALFNMLTIEPSYDTVLFKHLRQGAFHRVQLRKYIRYNDHLFSENVYNLMDIQQVEQTFEKISLAF